MRLHDFGRLDRHLLGELGDRDRLANRDSCLHRLGRQLEAVLAVGADGDAARARRVPRRVLFLVARADAAGDVQLLATVTRGVFRGIGHWRSPAPSRACDARDARRRRAATSAAARRWASLSCLARASSAARRASSACFFLEASSSIRLAVFRSMRSLSLRAASWRSRSACSSASCSLRFEIGLVLVLLVLLFENVALDIRLLAGAL